MNGLASFLGLCLLITITPGLDTAVVVRNALRAGRSAGLRTALGCAAGLFVHAVVVAVGLAELLLRSEAAFEAVKLAGAAVLIVLGVRTLWSAWRTGEPSEPEEPRRRGTPLVQGLLTNLTNPKATLFFVAVLPQFVPANQPGKAVAIALALATIAVLFSLTGLGLIALVVIALVVHRIRHLLHSRRVQRIQEGLLGATLVALGLRVAVE